MSPDDQDRFNSYYSQWMEDRHSNNRDDMIAMEHRMQDLMNRYGIPPDTPYGEVAAENAQPRGSAGRWQRSLSPDEQRNFNDEYRKWQDANAKNDRDDIDKHASQDGRNHAAVQHSAGHPFDEIAAGGYSQPRYHYRDFQGRFSPDDQQRFDKTYEHWQKDRARNDRDDIAKDEGRMQEIMARYNIPREVP
jgi:hypothetical protein